MRYAARSKQLSAILLVAVFLPAVVPADDPYPDLYGWTFEGTAFNGPAYRVRTSNGLPVLEYNNQSRTVTNPVAFGGAAVELRETTQSYLRLTNSFLSGGMSRLSISAWVNPRAIEINDRIVTRYPAGGANGELIFDFFQSNEFRPRLRMRDAGSLGGQYVNVGGNDTGVWSHVVVVFDGTAASSDDRIRFWVNNVEKADSDAGTTPASIPALTSEWRIGQDSSSGGRFDGYMDEILFAERALTPAEIGTLYNAGLMALMPPCGTVVVIK